MEYVRRGKVLDLKIEQSRGLRECGQRKGTFVILYYYYNNIIWGYMIITPD